MATAAPSISADLRVLDQAHDRLQLSWADIGAIIGVDESTVHRWRSRTSVPRPMARTRVAQLHETLDLLRRLFAGPDLARQWVTEKKPKGLGGSETPLDVMRTGRIDRVLMLLHFLARGA
jgi:hypothetical protein